METPLPGAGLFGPSNPAQPQISSEQKQIEELKKALQSQPTTLDDPARQALLKELDALSRDLSRDGLSKEEALARLSEAENKLEKALDPQSSAERAALDELAKQLPAPGNSDLKQAGESLRNGDAKQAADSLKQAGQNASSMTPEERKALADTLRQARDSTASLDPALARSLNDASQALASQDSKAAQQAMNNLGQTVE